MDADGLSEKQRIELSTARGFLHFFNAQHGFSYEVECVAGNGEVPDVVARDTNGNGLNIEVTLTEDQPGDIAAALGRSDHKSLEALRAHLKAVREGKESLQYSNLRGNVIELLQERISKKLIMRYGANTALVIRETSGVNWDWQKVIPQLQAYLDEKHVPFDCGIWLLSINKDQLTHVYGNVRWSTY